MVIYTFRPIGPRSGIPENKARAAVGTIPILSQDLPTCDAAVQIFEARGNHLTHFGLFGTDPLRDNPDLILQREEMFTSNNPSFATIFGHVACGNKATLEAALLCFVNITKALSQQ